MTNERDAELLARFRSGDSRALDVILARYEVALFQFLVGILHDHHQAEDVLQETFVCALQRLEGVDPEHLRGWLFTVAYHQAMLAKRKQRARPALPLPAKDRETNGSVPDPSPGPVNLVEQQEEARQLRELLEQLPDGQREVIRQRVYEGKRFREIADTLGCPLNTALARMHQGLKRLRGLWEQNHA